MKMVIEEATAVQVPQEIESSLESEALMLFKTTTGWAESFKWQHIFEVDFLAGSGLICCFLRPITGLTLTSNSGNSSRDKSLVERHLSVLTESELEVEVESDSESEETELLSYELDEEDDDSEEEGEEIIMDSSVPWSLSK